MNELVEPSEPLRTALEHLQLEGAIFLRATYTEGWGIEGQGGSQFAAMMHPGADRLILFHVIANGRCWVSPPGGERYWANAGEVIVLPYGDAHLMGGAEPATPEHITNLLPTPPWEDMPVVRHGGGGDRTDVVCGFLHSADRLFHPAVGAFPPAFVVRPPLGAAKRWFDASIQYALEWSRGGSVAASTKLPELLLVEALQLHLATAPAVDSGWVASLRDPVLGPAMACIHGSPERKWTVAELAAEAAVSRSLLDARFRDVFGLSPIRYLREWRMHVAQELLSTTSVTVAAIARQVGYHSEEAFSRAFKRAFGRAPSLWRSARSRTHPYPSGGE